MSTRRAAPPQEVFLSHSGRDRAFVRRLAEMLRRHGVRTWYSEAHLVGAQRWHDEIGRALRRCDWFILVLSPGAIKSEWVKRELIFALNEKRFHERIIPVARDACDAARLSWTLSSFQFVNFIDDFDDGCRELLRIWGRPFEPEARARKSRRRR